MAKSDRVKVFLEDMNNKYDTILEYVRDIPEMKQDIRELKTRMDKNDQAHGQDIEQLKRTHPNMRQS
jgi:uncharacterized protein YoxC